MTVRASALPKHARLRLPQPPPKRRRAVADDTAMSTRKCHWRCAACGHLSDWWRAAERHADEMGHHRIEVAPPDLEGRA